LLVEIVGCCFGLACARFDGDALHFRLQFHFRIRLGVTHCVGYCKIGRLVL